MLSTIHSLGVSVPPVSSISCYYICTSFHFDQPEPVRLARANWTQAEDFIYLPHNNLRAILIIQRTKDHWRPLAGTVQLGKLENAQIRMLQQMQLLLTTTKAPNQVILLAQISSLAGPPNELVHYQLAGRHSRRAGTLPARWEALPTSWYTTSSLGSTPDKLVH
ncbi:hypothetical protein PCANC_06509 [Puccinia coronata f. sp. avenae]|uniref:Uncharacterized protein n=1 Tax=Puccinia coronata f. sp. avenae TaxID=200324 RepID=A0A2N5T509_9BASI|nr:hypothetical protein PCANC_06023 [Puccinia coronata f. sp. avenae]PLW46982.1 hypothetical protein PCANC_06509 [Puccinia coronata f. sp. avenae]